MLIAFDLERATEQVESSAARFRESEIYNLPRACSFAPFTVAYSLFRKPSELLNLVVLMSSHFEGCGDDAEGTILGRTTHGESIFILLGSLCSRMLQ